MLINLVLLYLHANVMEVFLTFTAFPEDNHAITILPHSSVVKSTTL